MCFAYGDQSCPFQLTCSNAVLAELKPVKYGHWDSGLPPNTALVRVILQRPSRRIVFVSACRECSPKVLPKKCLAFPDASSTFRNAVVNGSQGVQHPMVGSRRSQKSSLRPRKFNANGFRL